MTYPQNFPLANDLNVILQTGITKLTKRKEDLQNQLKTMKENEEKEQRANLYISEETWELLDNFIAKYKIEIAKPEIRETKKREKK
jgi:hypothetical protein